MNTPSIHAGDRFWIGNRKDGCPVEVIAPIVASDDWWACEDLESREQYIVHANRLRPISSEWQNVRTRTAATAR